MFGDLIAEEKGRIIGRRILNDDLNDKPQLEISAIGEGKINGNIEYTEIWTFKEKERPNGFKHGEGTGVLTVKNNVKEVIYIQGQGLGKITELGTMRYVGTDFYSTSSEKLSFMNELVGIFEFELKKSGEYDAKVWEWK